MSAEMFDKLIGIVAGSTLKPIERRQLNIEGTQTEEQVQFLRENSLSFNANDLLELSDEQLIKLSKSIRNLVTKIASKTGLKIHKEDLESLKEGKQNALIHELAHLTVVKRLRPEITENASLNVLTLLSGEEISIAMNVMYPYPKNEYTCTERAQIMTAPAFPSEADYYSMYTFIMKNGVKKEEIETIIEMIKSKPNNQVKAELLTVLEGLKT